MRENVNSTIRIKRDERIDTLRGMLLIVMTIDHFKGLLWKFVYQSFGFVSAAEGVTFISGFYFSMIYLRFISDTRVLIRAAGKRAFLIYKYYRIILFGLIGLSYLFPNFQTYWADWLHGFYQNPLRAMIAYLLLLQSPNWLDVFSMFIFLYFCIVFIFSIFIF